MPQKQVSKDTPTKSDRSHLCPIKTPQRVPIFGKRSKKDDSISCRPNPRFFSFFNGGVIPDITEDQLKEHILSEMNVSCIEVTGNKQNITNPSKSLAVILIKIFCLIIQIGNSILHQTF